MFSNKKTNVIKNPSLRTSLLSAEERMNAIEMSPATSSSESEDYSPSLSENTTLIGDLKAEANALINTSLITDSIDANQKDSESKKSSDGLELLKELKEEADELVPPPSIFEKAKKFLEKDEKEKSKYEKRLSETHALHHEALSITLHGPSEEKEIKEILPSLEPESNYKILKIFNLITQDKFLLFKLSSWVFIGIVMHDFYLYNKYPDERFGTTPADIFLGPLNHPHAFGSEQSNLNTLSNHLGSEKVTDGVDYFGGVLLFFIIPIIESSLKIFLRKPDEGSITFSLPALKEFIREHPAKFSFLSLQVLGFSYSYLIRLSALLGKKIKKISNYKIRKESCEAENKNFSYNEELADYVCSICQNWEELQPYLFGPDNSENCLNALLTNAKSPEDIYKKLFQLEKFNDFKTIDFSHQQLDEWSDENFKNVFDKLGQLTKNISLLEMSYKQTQQQGLSVPKIQTLLHLLQNTSVTTFKLTKQKLLTTNRDLILNGLKDTAIQNLYLSSLGLGNAGTDKLNQVIPTFKQLHHLDLADNDISDPPIKDLWNNLPKTVPSINLDNNLLSTDALPTNTIYLIESLSIAGMRYNNGGVDALAKVVQQKQFRDLNINNSKLKGSELATIAKEMNPAMKKFTASNNDLSVNYYAGNFFKQLPTSIEYLDLDNTALSANAGNLLGNYVERSPALTNLSIKNNYFNLGDFKSFLEKEFTSNIKTLDLSKLHLTDAHIDLLTTLLLTTQTQLTFINLNQNQLTDKSVIPLIKAMSAHNIQGFNLSENLLETPFCKALAEILPTSTFQTIDISKNAFDGDGLIEIIRATRNAQLIELYANYIALTRQHIKDIANAIIESPYPLNYVGNTDLNTDQRHALFSATSVTSLKVLSLQESNLNPADQHLLTRLALIPNVPYITVDSLQALLPPSIEATTFNLTSGLPALSANVESNNYSSTFPVLAGLSVGLVALYTIYHSISRYWHANKPSHSASTLFSNKNASPSADFDLEKQAPISKSTNFRN